VTTSFIQKYVVLVAGIRVLYDVLCLFAAFVLAGLFTQSLDTDFLLYLQDQVIYLGTFILVWCVAAMDQRLFSSRRSEALVALLFSVAKAFLSTVLFSAFLIILFFPDYFERDFFCVYAFIALCFLLLFRLIMGLSLWNLRRHGLNVRRILIIGSNDRSAHLVDVFLANERYGYSIEGFLEDDPERRPVLEGLGIPCLGDIQELENILVHRVIDGVYISLPVRSFYETIQSVAHLCEGVGVSVRFLADLFPLRMATSDVNRLSDIPMLSLGYEPSLQTRFALNRAIDIVASSIMLLLLSPIFLFLSLIIKIESRGPVFSHCEMVRAGRGTIRLLMFRTKCLESPEGLGFEVSGEEIRWTRIGRFLKRYGLDELPQLINVFLGQLNLTGSAHRTSGGVKVDRPL
jgi:hypothetical protein